MPLFSQLRANTLAETLELDLNAPVRHACLSVVCFALDRDDPGEIARETRRITKDLWDEGPSEIAFAAVQRPAFSAAAAYALDAVSTPLVITFPTRFQVVPRRAGSMRTG